MRVGQLAASSGIDRRTIWRIEKGEHAEWDTFEALAKALGAEPSEAIASGALEGESSPPQSEDGTDKPTEGAA